MTEPAYAHELYLLDAAAYSNVLSSAELAMKVGQPGPIDSSPYFLVARYYETRRNGLQCHRDKSARVERA